MFAFIKSIIIWLSEFPGSPLSPWDSFETLFDPHIFKILMECVFDVNVEYDGKTMDSGLFHSAFRKHLNSKPSTPMITELNELLNSIDFEKFFVDRDLQTCCQICELVYFIGTETSKYSKLGINALQFLSVEDKLCIESYIEKYKRDRIGKSILRDFDNLWLSVGDSHKSSFESLRRRLVLQFDADKYDQSPLTSCSSYVDEDYIDSLIWENKLLEDVIYKIN